MRMCARDLADGDHLIVSTAVTSDREKVRRYIRY